MPSQFDNTYHNVYRKPRFDDDMDEQLYKIAKEADEVLEMRPAEYPTLEKQHEYLDWLAEDFRSDPWLTHRFRKYTAGPKRYPWKNQRQLKRQHQFTFMTHWFVGCVLSWPIAAAIGRSFKVENGGVPVVPIQRWVHDFPKIDPGHYARKVFRYYSRWSCLALGYCFARYTTST